MKATILTGVRYMVAGSDCQSCIQGVQMVADTHLLSSSISRTLTQERTKAVSTLSISYLGT